MLLSYMELFRLTEALNAKSAGVPISEVAAKLDALSVEARAEIAKLVPSLLEKKPIPEPIPEPLSEEP